MDRIDQAVALLKDSKATGLSFYEARQVLVQNGFSNSEIDDAADRFDYSSSGTLHTQQSADDLSLANPQNAPIDHPLVTPIDGSFTSSQRWYNSAVAQGLLCMFSFGLVALAGQAYGVTRSLPALILFCCTVGASALMILYYGFVVRVAVFGRYRPIAYRGAAASLVSLVWLAALVIMTVELLRH